MKLPGVLVIFFGFVFAGHAQLREIPVSFITNLRNSSKQCADAEGNLTTVCPLCTGDLLAINFYRASLDKPARKLQLIGRVCRSGDPASGGLSYVSVFKAVSLADLLTGQSPVTGAAFDGAFISKDGFFDITIELAQYESLFFQHPTHFLTGFSLFKLLDDQQ